MREKEETATVSCKAISRFFLYAFILLKPMYILPSGTFQLGDLCLTISFLALLLHYGLNFRIQRIDGYYIAFLLGVLAVNTSYYLISELNSFLVYTSYYVFVLLGILVFREFYLDRQTLSTIVRILRFDLVLQLVIYVIGAGRWMDSVRYMGTFNDPNQFGVFVFFAFLFIKCTYLLKGEKSNLFDDVAALALVFVSVSTGMLLGFACYYACMYIRVLLNRRADRLAFVHATFLLVALVIICLFVIVNYDWLYHLAQGNSMGRRVMGKIAKLINGGDSGIAGFFADRALTKAFYYPQYFLYGSGEGWFSRFASIGSKNEMHSTVLGLFFYYGIIPFMFVCAWVIKNVKPAFRNDTWVVLIPLLIECMTLANQRQPMFWMLLILVGANLLKQATARELKSGDTPASSRAMPVRETAYIAKSRPSDSPDQSSKPSNYSVGLKIERAKHARGGTGGD